MDEVEDFLAHYGVKGMKWGERKARATSGQAKPKGPKAPPSQGVQTMKKIGTELGFGAIGPAAILAGLGPPVSIAIGLSVGVLRQPPVRQAIARTAKAQSDLIKEIGDTKLSAIRQAKETKEAAKKAAASARLT